MSGESESALRMRWIHTPSAHSNMEGTMSLGRPKAKSGPGSLRSGPVHHRRHQGALGHARMRRATAGAAALALDQPGQDADHAEVDGTPAPEGEAEEYRAVSVSLLFVAQAQSGR